MDDHAKDIKLGLKPSKPYHGRIPPDAVMVESEDISMRLIGQQVIDPKGAAGMVRSALWKLGMQCTETNSSIARTPERFISYLQEFFQPYNLEELLGEGFDAVHDQTGIHGMVVQSGIPFRGCCEHHLLPMLGYAYVGYIPNKKIVGISKLTRLVEAIGTEKPSLQEAITEKIADALFDNLDSRGSIVVIKAKHMCMSIRGVTSPDVITTTSCLRGLYRDVSSAREEFFFLAGVNK